MAKQKILVVDDEPHIRDSCRKILRRGYEVYEAENVRVGLRIHGYYEELGGQYDEERRMDLILLDQYMPLGNGEGMIGKLRSNTKLRRVKDNTLIIMMGISEQPEIRTIADYAEAGYIEKPFKRGALLKLIREALNQNR